MWKKILQMFLGGCNRVFPFCDLFVLLQRIREREKTGGYTTAVCIIWIELKVLEGSAVPVVFSGTLILQMGYVFRINVMLGFYLYINVCSNVETQYLYRMITPNVWKRYAPNASQRLHYFSVFNISIKIKRPNFKTTPSLSLSFRYRSEEALDINSV